MGVCCCLPVVSDCQYPTSDRFPKACQCLNGKVSSEKVKDSLLVVVLFCVVCKLLVTSGEISMYTRGCL